MSWPTSQDYNEVIQNPVSCFSDPELKQGTAVCNTMGLPVPCSGNFADVYAVETPQRKWAVKCFTRQIPGLRERYLQISKYLPQVKLPFMVEFKFLDQGIRVRGQWYPVLKMHWVEGVALNTFIREQLDKPPVLRTLGQIWVKIAARLREARLAHCDLQHGNVLLVPGARAGSLDVRLVDYDGMCVPALDLLKSIELGHPNYQHPQRSREGTYGLEIDRFSLLAIYVAIRALMEGGRPLWDRYDNGDNLLFKEADFLAPHQSPLFAELLRLNDPQTRSVAARLMAAAQKPLEQTPLLEELVPAEKPAAKPAMRPASTTSAQHAGASAWDFSGEEDGSERKSEGTSARRKQGGIPGWGWVAGVSAALLAVVGIIAVALPKGDDKDKGPAVAEHRTNTPPTRPRKNPEKQPPKDQQKPPPKDGSKQPKDSTKPPPPKDESKPPKDGTRPPTKDGTKPPDIPEIPPVVVGGSRILPGNQDFIRDAVFSEDGKRAVVSDAGGRIHVWDMAKLRRVAVWPGIGRDLHRIVLTRNADNLLCLSDFIFLRLVDLKTGQVIRKFPPSGAGVFAIAISPDGKRAATAGGGVSARGHSMTFDDYQVYIWDLEAGTRAGMWKGHRGQIRSLAFTSDGKKLVSVGGDGVSLWDTASGKQLRFWDRYPRNYTSWISPDGRYLVRKHQGSAELWDINTEKSTSIPGIPFPNLLGFAGGWRVLLRCGFGLDKESSVLMLWDIKAGKEVSLLKGHSGSIDGIAVSSDARRALTWGADKTLRLWDLTKPDKEWTFASWTASNPPPDCSAVTQGAQWNMNVSRGAKPPWNDPSYLYKVGETPIPGQNGLYTPDKAYPAGRGTVRAYIPRMAFGHFR